MSLFYKINKAKCIFSKKKNSTRNTNKLSDSNTHTFTAGILRAGKLILDFYTDAFSAALFVSRVTMICD
jgi:hypothetical protein